MSGLERWAKARGSDLQELRLLADANGNSWDEYFKNYETSESDIPVGRATAFHGMLQRGRSGDVKIPIGNIAIVMGIDMQDLMDILDDGSMIDYKPYINDGQDSIEGKCLDSDVLPVCLANIRAKYEGSEAAFEGLRDLVARFEGNDKLTLGDAAAYDGEGTADNKKKAPRPARRKTKYSLGRNAVAEMLKPKDDGLDIKDVRMFLLSMPDWKPQEVAVMSDQEVTENFTKSYRAVSIGDDMLIVTEQAHAGLMEYLNGIEAYYIPKAKPAEVTSE